MKRGNYFYGGYHCLCSSRGELTRLGTKYIDASSSEPLEKSVADVFRNFLGKV